MCKKDYMREQAVRRSALELTGALSKWWSRVILDHGACSGKTAVVCWDAADRAGRRLRSAVRACIRAERLQKLEKGRRAG